MKIGIMLRHYEQHGGGVQLYTKYLLKEILQLDTKHEFVLMYRNPELIGTYSNLGNHIKEVAETSPSVFTWDQISVPKIAKREKLDLIFNPKYSIPLNVKCPTVFVSHGLDWYVMPWASRWFDRLSHKYLIPRYANKADTIIAVSNITKEHVIKYLKKPEDRVKTIYLGLNEAFRKKYSEEVLEETKKKYKLPDKYFLFAGQIYPPKNFGRIIEAFAKVGPKHGISLVLAGEPRWLVEEDIKKIEDLGISKLVHQPGWIEHETLAHFYSLAQALLLPSLYEACPSPVLEAMASGCPLLTSDRYGTKELAGNAGLLVNPESVDSIAEGMEKIVTDDNLRKELVEAGYKRSSEFNWQKCATETLELLDEVLQRNYGK